MSGSFDERKEKNYTLMRSVLDYGMGVIILAFGLFFLVASKWGIDFNIEPVFRNLFGGMCIVYGAWRIYRGYQKKYFQD
jgi:hypothetical protein